nr:MAG TPA: hypothetical protein [Caudoviricetes sp.]
MTEGHDGEVDGRPRGPPLRHRASRTPPPTKGAE